MRQAVVARSFCTGRSHGIALQRFLPGSRNAPFASLPQRFLLGSHHAPLAGLTPCAPCWAHTMRLAELPVKLCQSPTPFPLPSKAWQSPSARLWEETGVRPGNRSNRREPERSVQEPKQSDEEPRVRVGEPLPSESEGPAAPESEDIRTRIGRPAAPDRANADVANLQASIRFPHMHPRRRWTTV